MELRDLLNNHLLINAMAAWATAQILKTIIYAATNKTLDWERLFGDGGMPSGHSATVTALAVTAGLEYGLGSPYFALAATLAVIVMHDAMGVRRETGIQAMVLNDIIKVLDDMGSDMPPQDKLKEFVGHTPFQVLVGGILGILLAILICS